MNKGAIRNTRCAWKGKFCVQEHFQVARVFLCGNGQGGLEHQRFGQHFIGRIFFQFRPQRRQDNRPENGPVKGRQQGDSHSRADAFRVFQIGQHLHKAHKRADQPHGRCDFRSAPHDAGGAQVPLHLGVHIVPQNALYILGGLPVNNHAQGLLQKGFYGGFRLVSRKSEHPPLRATTATSIRLRASLSWFLTGRTKE